MKRLAGSVSVRRGPASPIAVTSEQLDALYRAFFLRLVRRVTWRFRLSEEDACEIVHDAFLLALIRLNVEGNPLGWLYRVVDNLAMNRRRKEYRHASLMARWGPTASEIEETRADAVEGEGGQP
jgi:DNA-directed RNA polymerase specialized sigma24 family protein